MIFLRYDDVPGVIGRVGTLLGEAGVNIANMTVSRNREGGKALMVLSLDAPATTDVLARLGVGVDDAFLVGIRPPGRLHARAAAPDGAGRSTSGGRPADISCTFSEVRAPPSARDEASRPQELSEVLLAPGAFLWFC